MYSVGLPSLIVFLPRKRTFMSSVLREELRGFVRAQLIVSYRQ
jgi:hypothetical protein